MNIQEKIADIQRQLDKVKREAKVCKSKQIDWSSVKEGTLVRVSDSKKRTTLSEYKKYFPGSRYPHTSGKDAVGWKYATLETGQWIFNDKGENPWPEGVIVELWFRNSYEASEGIYRPCRSNWCQSGNCDDIIASRCIGLEKGWKW